MGYFSNGTEGDIWQERHCSKCVHRNTDERTCMILHLHMLWNYDQFPEHAKSDEERGEAKTAREFLEALIPKDAENPIWNGDCTMRHVEVTDAT